MSDRRALLFDLDDTLVVEEPAAVAAFAATADWAATQRAVDAAALARTAWVRARELWYATPAHAWCRRIGISSWEGLWCRFEGGEPDVCWLRAWAPTYRREAWRLALADQGVVDDALAEELGERFGRERRERHQTFADAAAALTMLAADYALALVTNGASCLQREKLAASGLGGRFAVVVVSAEVGAGKPDAAVFQHALAQLGCDPARATMVGDSLRKDIGGALAADLGAVWLNRSNHRDPGMPDGVPQIATLTDLPAALAALPTRRVLLTRKIAPANSENFDDYPEKIPAK
jgi:putative hydrolase of the HAD superfamily